MVTIVLVFKNELKKNSLNFFTLDGRRTFTLVHLMWPCEWSNRAIICYLTWKYKIRLSTHFNERVFNFVYQTMVFEIFGLCAILRKCNRNTVFNFCSILNFFPWLWTRWNTYCSFHRPKTGSTCTSLQLLKLQSILKFRSVNKEKTDLIKIQCNLPTHIQQTRWWHLIFSVALWGIFKEICRQNNKRNLTH